MADNEVKIHVSADADLKGIEATQKKIQDLHKAATAYESKGMDTAASSARADARGLERDVARFTRERAAEEKRVTGELREQEALRKAGVRQQSQIIGMLGRLGMGAIGAEIASSIVDQLAANESLGNRGVATEARNKRQHTILNSIRGTSGQVASEAWSAEDNVAHLKHERPQLETDAKYGTLRAAGEGALWGGGIGATIGSFVLPGVGTAIGAGVGATAGAAIRGIPAYFQGQNRINQSEQDQKQEEERAAKLSELAPKLFMEQEGGLQMGALRGRSKRSLEGQREAFVNEMSEQWLGVYRDIYNRTKGNDGMAKEMADMTVENALRDRQAQAGAGLVDAKTGAGGVAAAAQWASGAFPGMAEVGAKIDGLHTTVQAGNQALQLVNQAK